MLTNEGHAVADDRDRTTPAARGPDRPSGGAGPRGRPAPVGWRPRYELVFHPFLFGEAVLERRHGDYTRFESPEEFGDARAEAALTYLSNLAAPGGKRSWQRAGTLKIDAERWMNLYMSATDLLVAAKQLGLPVRKRAVLWLLPRSSPTERRDLVVESPEVEMQILVPDPDAFAKAQVRAHERWLKRRSRKFWPGAESGQAA